MALYFIELVFVVKDDKVKRLIRLIFELIKAHGR